MLSPERQMPYTMSTFLEAPGPRVTVSVLIAISAGDAEPRGSAVQPRLPAGRRESSGVRAGGVRGPIPCAPVPGAGALRPCPAGHGAPGAGGIGSCRHPPPLCLFRVPTRAGAAWGALR